MDLSFQEAAVAETTQPELVEAARAAIAKMDNFMVGVVGYVVVLLIIIDLRELSQFHVSFYVLYRIISIYLHYCSAKIELLDPGVLARNNLHRPEEKWFG